MDEDVFNAVEDLLSRLGDMDEKMKKDVLLLIREVKRGDATSSIEIGSLTKGAKIKVYVDPSDYEDGETRVMNMFLLSDLAQKQFIRREKAKKDPESPVFHANVSDKDKVIIA